MKQTFTLTAAELLQAVGEYLIRHEMVALKPHHKMNVSGAVRKENSFSGEIFPNEDEKEVQVIKEAEVISPLKESKSKDSIFHRFLRIGSMEEKKDEGKSDL